MFNRPQINTVEAVNNHETTVMIKGTSEIKISVVIAERYLEVAVRSIHNVFDLGNNEAAK